MPPTIPLLEYWKEFLLLFSGVVNVVAILYLLRSRKTNLDAQTSGIHLSNLKGEGDLATQFRSLIGTNIELEKKLAATEKLYEVSEEGRKRTEGRLFEVAKTMGSLETSEALAREQCEEVKKKERGILTEIRDAVVKSDVNE